MVFRPGAGRRRRIVIGGLAGVIASGLLAVVPVRVASADPTAAATVSSCSGSGPGSLLTTVESAASGVTTTITFAFTSPCSTILLTSPIDITADVIIQGPGANSLAVSGQNEVQVFDVSSGVTATISGLTIENGFLFDLTQGGAGIDNLGSLTVSDSTMVGNSAYEAHGGGQPGPDAGLGGGVLNSGALTVTNSTLSDNTASAGGGGIYNEGTLTVADSTLSGNSAPGGGGIANATDSNPSSVTNSTLSGNSAASGGGIGNSGTLTVTNSTLSGNSANTDYGGGIWNGGKISLTAVIVAKSPSGDDCGQSGGSITITDGRYNIDDDGSCGFSGTSTSDSSTLDASVGSLADNGGPTQTIALTGGPAVDVVPAADCPATDQRGAPRAAPCDIGAYDTDVAPFKTAISVTVSGSQTFGGSPTMTYSATSPGGATASGTLVCRTVNDGTSISSVLPVGSYTVDGSSCSGLTSSDPTDYPIFPSSYVGATGGFTVTLPTTMTTVVQQGGHDVTSVLPGTTVTDQATVAAPAGDAAPTGTVTFTFFPNNDCASGTGTSLATSSGLSAVTGTSVSVATSVATSALSAGTDSIQASYSDGDDGSSTSACEPLAVASAGPSGSTCVSAPASGCPGPYGWGSSPGNASTSSPTPVVVSTTNSSTSPASDLPSGATITAVASGGGTDLALTSGGKVYAWGDNTDGQVGQAAGGSYSTPQAVSLPDAIVAIAEGDGFSLALSARGKVYAWGDDADGQLGEGPNTALTDSSTPVQVDLNTSSPTSPANNPNQRNSPAVIGNGEAIEAIAAESNGALALTSAGTVYAWGDAQGGELGDGATTGDTCTNDTCQDTPKEVSQLPQGVTVQAIAGGDDYALAIASSTSGPSTAVYAWGTDSDGQLGTGKIDGDACPNAQNVDTCWAVPQKVTGLPSGTIDNVSAGEAQSLALTSTGSVYAWGDDTDGELANGTISTAGSATPSEVTSFPSGTTISEVSAGSDDDLALSSAGDLFSWGEQTTDGELGNGEAGNACSGSCQNAPVQVLLPGGVTVTPCATCVADGEAQIAAGSGQGLTVTTAAPEVTPNVVCVPSTLPETESTPPLCNGGTWPTAGAIPSAATNQAGYQLSVDSAATSGKFKLSWNGTSTSLLTYDDSLTDVTNALSAIGLTSTQVTVAGGPLGTAPITITPVGSDLSTSPLTVTDSSVSPGTVSLSYGETCATTPADATKALYDWFNTNAMSGTPTSPIDVLFPPNACYLVDGIVFLRGLRNVVVDGNDSLFVQSSWSIANGQVTVPTPDSFYTKTSDPPPTTTPYCQDSTNTYSTANAAATALGDVEFDNGDPAPTIMWFIDGGCDLAFEHMNITGAVVPTKTINTGATYDGSNDIPIQQDSAFEVAGTQRIVLSDDNVQSVYGDCFTVTGLHESPVDHPASDVSITGNLCHDAWRDAVSVEFANRVDVGGTPSASASTSSSGAPSASYCTPSTTATSNTGLSGTGNCLSDYGANGVDIESDGGDPAGGEGNLQVANNVFATGPQQSGTPDIVSGQTRGQLFNVGFDSNRVDAMQVDLKPQSGPTCVTLSTTGSPTGGDITLTWTNAAGTNSATATVSYNTTTDLWPNARKVTNALNKALSAANFTFTVSGSGGPLFTKPVELCGFPGSQSDPAVNHLTVGTSLTGSGTVTTSNAPPIPGTNVLVDGNVANNGATWNDPDCTVKCDMNFDDEVGGLVAGNSAPMADLYNNVTYNNVFVDTGQTGAGFAVQNNQLGQANASPATVPVSAETTPESASGDTECDNNTLGSTPTPGSAGSLDTATSLVACNPTVTPLTPVPASAPTNGARQRTRQRPRHRAVHAGPAQGQGGDAPPGDVSCSLDGTVNFDPPLSSTVSAASEMALVTLALSNCSGSEGATTPTGGTAAVAVPLASSNCATVTSPSVSPPTSLAVSWSPSDLGGSEVRFQGFGATGAGGLTLGGPGTSVDGSNPGIDDGALSGATLDLANPDGSAMTAGEISAACAAAGGLASAAITGTVNIGDASAGDSSPGGPCAPGADKDLSDCDYAGQDLTGDDFAGSVLTGADFAGATLSDATLTGASSNGPDGVDFAGATLTGANLSDVDFLDATFTDATLTGANLTGAIVGDADLPPPGSDFTGADFTGATLTDAQILDDTVMDANFTNAVLTDSTWTGTDALGSATNTFANTTCPDGSDSSARSPQTCVFSPPDTSTTRVSASATTTVVGQPVTYSVTVTGSAPGVDPTGTVRLSDLAGSSPGCASVTLLPVLPEATSASSFGSCTTTYTEPVSGTVTASYGGDENYGPSSSSTSESLSQAASTTTIAASTTSAVTGQSITVSATVSGPPGNTVTPTGTVAFSETGAGPALPSSCASVTLSGSGGTATASCSITVGLSAATSVLPTTLHAVYSGDSNFTPSADGSDASVTNLSPAPTNVVLSSSADPALSGQALVLSALVVPNAPGSGTPTGTVTFASAVAGFSCSNAGGVTQILVGGPATCAVPADVFTAATGIAVTASYSGAGSSSPFVASYGPASSTLTEAELQTLFTSPAAASATVGVPFSFTVTTTSTETPALGLGAYSSLPAGVSLTDNGDGTATLAGDSTVAAGVYTFVLQATDSQTTTDQVFTLTVSSYTPPPPPPPLPVFTSAASASAVAGSAFNFSVTTSNGYAIISSHTPLPPWLTLTNKIYTGSATLSASDPIVGVYHLVLVATSPIGFTQQRFTLTVDKAAIAPSFTSAAKATATADVAFRFTVKTTGVPVPALSGSGLPSWLSLTDDHNGTATLAATTPQKGKYSFTITATNIAKAVTQRFTLAVS